MNIYRDIDIDLIKDNLPSLQEKFEREFIQKYKEPSMDEMDKTNKIIFNYIRNNKLIVYGGFAQNLLIETKEKGAGFYKDIDLADIEFYSPTPIKHLIELCDLLYKSGLKNVQGKEGSHPETYKLFSNFHNYADISYMSQNIYDNMETIMIDGMRITHPHFIYVDALRVYTDPLTSNFRLIRTFNRMTLMMRYYPLNDNHLYNQIEFKNINKDRDEFIRKQIVQKMKIVLIGFHAFNRLMKKANMKDNYFLQEPYYQLISIDFKKDMTHIYKLLQTKYGKKIRYKIYHPFFQFFDISVEFYYGDQLILRLYGRNERCIQYKYSEKKNTYYGSFQLLQLYTLALYQQNVIRKNQFNKNLYMTMFVRLIKARNKYLEDNNRSVLDNTPFQEFTLQCMGEPVDTLRESLLTGLKNIKNKRPVKFTYNAKGEKGKVPNFSFSNSSGELIKK